MSTKPLIIPVWDTGNVNSSAPTSGHRASGYGINEIPTSTEINGEFNQIGQWLQYLSDGSFSGGLTLAGDLTLTSGDLTLGGFVLNQTTKALATTNTNNLDVSGVGSLDNITAVKLTSAASAPYTITGLSGGTEGRILILWNQTPGTVSLVAASSSSTATNRFSTFGQNSNPSGSGASIDIPVGGIVAVIWHNVTNPWSLLWKNFRSDRQIYTGPGSGLPQGSPHSIGMVSVIYGLSTAPVWFPIPLDLGDTLTSYSLTIDKNAGGTLAIDIVYFNLISGAETVVASTHVAQSSTGTSLGLGLTGLSVTNLGGPVYLRVTPANNVTPSADRSYGMAFTVASR